MGVVSPTAGLSNQNSKIIDLLGKILSELKQGDTSCPIGKETSSKGLKVYQKAHMVWWSKLPNAASYRLTLFVGTGNIGKQEIDVIEVERNKAYHTFTDLVGANMYTVHLEAEDRDGNIIDSVEIVL